MKIGLLGSRMGQKRDTRWDDSAEGDCLELMKTRQAPAPAIGTSHTSWPDPAAGEKVDAG